MPKKKLTITEIGIYEGIIRRVIGGQYFDDELGLYITPIYAVITYRNVETGETFEIIDIVPYILYVRRKSDSDVEIGLVRYTEDVLRLEFNLYNRTAPDTSDVRLPPELINDLRSRKTMKAYPPHVTFSLVRKVFDKYLDCPDPRILDFFSLWTMGTYVYSIFDAYPYVYVQGMKESAKTKCLEIFEVLAYNAKNSVSISPASLFRVVEASGCTLLIDESEEIAADKGTQLKRLLYSGYKKYGGKVYRTEEVELTGRKKKVPLQFEVYSPKALANIEGIEDVLEDRCISITMMRGKDKKKIMRAVNPKDPDVLQARYALYSSALFFHQSLKEVYDEIEMPPVEVKKMSGRLWELWRPIYAIACWIVASMKGVSPVKVAYHPNDYPFVKRLVEFMEERILAKRIVDENQNLDYIVAKALGLLVTHDDWYSCTDIRDMVLSMLPEDSPLLKKVNSRKISDILKRHFGFEAIRTIGNRRYHYIEVNKVDDILTRLNISREELLEEEVSGVAEEAQS